MGQYLFTSETPATNTFDGAALTVGMKFKSAKDGRITKVRHWKQAACTETYHKVGIWDQAGGLIGLGVSSGESTGTAGWLEIPLFIPVDIVAGTHYTCAFWCNSGYFSYTSNVFIADVVNGDLTGIIYSSASPGNGVGSYTSDIDYPTGASAGRWNYFADPYFAPHVTEDLPVTGNSTPDNWNLTGESTKALAVAASGDDTSYIGSTGSTNTQQQFVLSNPAVATAVDELISVSFTYRAKRGGSQDTDSHLTLVLGGNTTVGTTRTGTNTFQTWTETFYEKPGGGAWTLTDVQNLEIRVQNDASRIVQCSTLYATLAFELAPPLAPPLWFDSVTVTDVATVVRSGGATLTININETVTVTEIINRVKVSGSFISIWPENPTPIITDSSTTNTVVVGTIFTARVSGLIYGVRTYRGPQNVNGLSFSHIYENGNSSYVLQMAVSSNAFGWARQFASIPLRITANKQYICTTAHVLGHYVLDPAYFVDNEHVAPHGLLTAIWTSDDTQAIGNGRYIQAPSGTYPNLNPDGNACYWVDVLFVPDPYVEKVETVAVTENFTVSVSSLPDLTVSKFEGPVVTEVRSVFVSGGPDLTVNLDEDITVTDLAGIIRKTYVEIIPSDPPPNLGDSGTATTCTVGTVFKTRTSGTVVAIKTYKGTGSISGLGLSNIFNNATGFQLSGGSVFYTDTAVGWHRQWGTAPLMRLEANTEYVVTATYLGGHYSYSPGYFDESAYANGSLTAIASADDTEAIGNGRLINTYNVYPNTNPDGHAYYHVDILFLEDPWKYTFESTTVTEVFTVQIANWAVRLDEDVLVTEFRAVTQLFVGTYGIVEVETTAVTDPFTIRFNSWTIRLDEDIFVTDPRTITFASVSGERTVSQTEAPSVTEVFTVTINRWIVRLDDDVFVTEFRAVAVFNAATLYPILDEDIFVTEFRALLFNRWIVRATEDIFVTDFYPAGVDPYVDLSGLTNNLQWLVTLYTVSSVTPDFAWTNGEERVIDFGGGGVAFTKALADDFQLGKSWSDILYGISVTDDLSFSIDNSDGTYTAAFYTNVQAGAEWRGAEVRAYRYDWGASVYYEEFVGVVESFEFGDIITFQCISLDTDLLQVQIPREFINTTRFPRAHVDSLGQPISVFYGFAQNVPCYRINQYLGIPDDDPLDPDFSLVPGFESTPVYDYLVGRGNIGVDVVYRDGIVVEAEEYTITTALYRGFTVLRFYTDQTDFGGAEYFITADVHGIYPDEPRRGIWRDTIFEETTLLAYYRMNRTDVLDDEGPYNLNGTLTGPVLTGLRGGVPGDSDVAMHFAGLQKFSVPDNDLLYPPGYAVSPKPLGMVFLFRHDGTVVDATETIIAKYTGSPNAQGWRVYLEPSTGKIYFQIWNTAGTTTSVNSGAKNYCDQKWHVLMCSYDNPPSPRLRMWVDFVEVANTSTAIVMADTTNPMTIGMRYDDILKYRGDLDELALFTDDLVSFNTPLAHTFVGTLCEYKFNGYLGLADNGPNRIALTFPSPTVEHTQIPGYTGLGKSGIQLQNDTFLGQFHADGKPLMSQVNFLFRVVLNSPQSWGDTATPGWVLRGPYSIKASDGTTAKGWGLYFTGNASTCSYEFRIMTSGGLKTIAFNNIGYDVWRDLYVTFAPTESSGAGRMRGFLDGVQIAQVNSSGDAVYELADPYAWDLVFGQLLGHATGWAVKLGYLAVRGQDPAGEASNPWVEHNHFDRNGIEFLKRLLTDDNWGLQQVTDNSFPTAMDDWNAVNAGQGIPVDMELVEPTNSKDIIDSVLKLRGGRLYRAAGNNWGIEIDKPADLTQRFRFGHGDGQADNIVNVPTFARSTLADMIKTLAILYRSNRDVGSGQFKGYAFSIEKDILTRGTFYLLEMPSLHDHRTAVVFGDYYSKKLISADERLRCEVEEISGRLAQPGSLCEISIPRWGINRELYRVQSIKKGLDKHDIEMFKYDENTYTPLIDPDLPSDPVTPDRYPEPKLGNWELVLDPIIVDSVLIGIEARPLIRYTATLGSIVSQQLTSFVTAGNNLLYLNDGNPTTWLYAPTGAYPLEDVYTVDPSVLPTFKESHISSVDIVVQISNRTLDNTGTYRVRYQIGAGAVTLVKEVVMNNALYPQHQNIIETHRLPRTPTGGPWTLADLAIMKVYLAVGSDVGGKAASFRNCWIKVSTYPTDKLPMDFDSWMVWRRNAATPVPDPYEDAPDFNGKSNLFYDTAMDGTGMTTLYYHVGMRNRQGMMSATKVSDVTVNLTT